MPPARQRTNGDGTKSEINKGRASGASRRPRGGAAAASNANAEQSQQGKDAGRQNAHSTAKNNAAGGSGQAGKTTPASVGVSWSTMPLSVLHDYRFAFNLDCPSAFALAASPIYLSQGVGLRSPTAIAARRAQRAAAKRKRAEHPHTEPNGHKNKSRHNNYHHHHEHMHNHNHNTNHQHNRRRPLHSQRPSAVASSSGVQTEPRGRSPPPRMNGQGQDVDNIPPTHAESPLMLSPKTLEPQQPQSSLQSPPQSPSSPNQNPQLQQTEDIPPYHPSQSSTFKPVSSTSLSTSSYPHDQQNSTHQPPLVQDRVTKDELANAVQKHFHDMGISEQDTITKFMYTVSEEGRGRDFRLRFQPG